jgi:hypothetical protein
MAQLRLPDLVESQRAERYRALIIHAEPVAGKTRTARRLAEVVPDATYLDFMEEFLRHLDWCAGIDRYRLDDLAHYLLGLDIPGQVVIVDHLDFLLTTWARGRKQGFVRWVDEGLDGFTVTDKVFVFFVQTDADIVSYPMRRLNVAGQKRLYRLDEFYAL